MGRTVIGPAGTPYSAALKIQAGETVYVSGQLAIDANGTLVGDADLEAQARFIFSSIERLLVEAGATLRDVVKITAYITTLEGYSSYGQVRRDVFGDRLPTSATVQVAGLVVPGCLIEIDAIAVLET